MGAKVILREIAVYFRSGIAVAWQGVNKSADGGDTNSCGYGDYGDDNGKHRLVSYDIYVGV